MLHLATSEIVAGYVRVPTNACVSARLPSPRAICVLACTVAATTLITPLACEAAVPPARVANGLLRTCAPTTWACVSTQDDAPASFIEPWSYETGEATARERLLTAVQLEGGTIDQLDGRYLRVLFGTDEIEFYFTEGDYTIQVRADGIHHPKFDWGRNRRRAERLRRASGFESIPVLRGRTRKLPFLESPLDEFAPSLPDGDALIDKIRGGDRILDQTFPN